MVANVCEAADADANNNDCIILKNDLLELLGCKNTQGPPFTNMV